MTEALEMTENEGSPERDTEHCVQAVACATEIDIQRAAMHAAKPWLFKPGTCPNPKGRPRKADGAKVDRRTLMRQAFEMGAEDVIAKLLELAKAGDIKAIDIAMKYTMPQAKAESGLLDLDLPTEATVEDRLAAITLAMTEGRISPETAALASKAIRDQTEAAKILQASQGIAELQAQLKAKTARGHTL